VIAALAIVAELVLGGGRKPYGGDVELRVSDASAIVDPHAALDRSGRMLAALTHCHLFRPVQALDGHIDIVPELAAGPGAFSGGALTVTLVDGARFHDDAPVTSADVIASMKRLATVGPLKALFAEVKASDAAGRALVLQFPKGAQLDEVMALLARPEAAILHGGRAVQGAGCGPYRASGTDPRGITLDAFGGHPEGRPFLDRVHVEVRAERGPRELATAFRYGEVDVAWEPVQGAPAGAVNLGGGWASWLAIVRPGLRQNDRLGLRRKMFAATRDARLARYIEGRGAVAVTPWPEPLAPTSTAIGAGDASTLLGLVIAYPDGDDELAELARALRDALRMVASDNARVVPVARLTAQSAARQSDPIWDLAVVRHEWAASTRATAALELADLLGLPGLAASDVLSGQTRRWADAVQARVDVIPLAHAPRGVMLSAGVRGVSASSGVPGLADGYRPFKARP